MYGALRLGPSGSAVLCRQSGVRRHGAAARRAGALPAASGWRVCTGSRGAHAAGAMTLRWDARRRGAEGCKPPVSGSWRGVRVRLRALPRLALRAASLALGALASGGGGLGAADARGARSAALGESFAQRRDVGLYVRAYGRMVSQVFIMSRNYDVEQPNNNNNYYDGYGGNGGGPQYDQYPRPAPPADGESGAVSAAPWVVAVVVISIMLATTCVMFGVQSKLFNPAASTRQNLAVYCNALLSSICEPPQRDENRAGCCYLIGLLIAACFVLPPGLLIGLEYAVFCMIHSRCNRASPSKTMRQTTERRQMKPFMLDGDIEAPPPGERAAIRLSQEKKATQQGVREVRGNRSRRTRVRRHRSPRSRSRHLLCHCRCRLRFLPRRLLRCPRHCLLLSRRRKKLRRRCRPRLLLRSRSRRGGRDAHGRSRWCRLLSWLRRWHQRQLLPSSSSRQAAAAAPR